MFLDFLPSSSSVPFSTGVLWLFWFIVVGGIIGFLMDKFQPILDKHDSYRRILFTLVVLFGSLVLGRLPQTYAVYGTIFREGPAVIYWTAALPIGVWIYNIFSLKRFK